MEKSFEVSDGQISFILLVYFYMLLKMILKPN
jgi:hypothetical protein